MQVDVRQKSWVTLIYLLRAHRDYVALMLPISEHFYNHNKCSLCARLHAIHEPANSDEISPIFLNLCAHCFRIAVLWLTEQLIMIDKSVHGCGRWWWSTTGGCWKHISGFVAFCGVSYLYGYMEHYSKKHIEQYRRIFQLTYLLRSFSGPRNR